GLEHDRGLVAARGQVPVQAFDAGVELAVGVPADVEIAGIEAGVLHPGRRAHPVQAPGGLAPEGVWFLDGTGVEALVLDGIEGHGGCWAPWVPGDFLPMPRPRHGSMMLVPSP